MTEIHDSHGPVHTGDGDQFLGPTVVLNMVQDAIKRMRDTAGMPQDDIRWLKRRFVPPTNLGTARGQLLDTRTVVLTGPTGSGRRTAAKMLLHELSSKGGVFGELAEESASPEAKLAASWVDVGHRILLDLSHSDEETFRARQRELPGFRAVLEQHDAHLVVVVPDDVEHAVHADLAHHIVSMGRPCGKLVLQRQLEAEGINITVKESDFDGLTEYLAGPIRDIANLARSVIRASEAKREAPACEWLRDALAVLADRSKEVTDQVAEHSSGRSRAVLLTAAMCREASPDAVFFAAEQLLESLELTAGEKPRLEQEGYRKQLDNLTVEVTHHQRIDFARFAYDRAIRTYFWDNYPDLRRPLSQWVGDVIGLHWFTHHDREQLLGRFLEQSLRTDGADEVLALIERWVRPNNNQQRAYWMQFAATALITGLTDERHGQKFRKRVYEWSRNNDLPAHVGQLLVRVCTDVIAPNFPEQALVRLLQRARREDDAVEPTARQALRELATSSPFLLRFLLDRLVTGLQNLQWPADVHLFLDITDPRLLTQTRTRSKPITADAVVRAQLVQGWRAVLVHQPELAWPRVRHWLEAAGKVATPHLLLGILVEAASHSVGLLGSLHVVARDWSVSGTGRPEVAAQLSPLIDMAQGIHSSDYTIDPEEATR